jgi:GT2 family glycosyltransferase
MDRIPDLQIIDALDKQGHAYPLNVGINAARGDKILLCDADDMVGEGWLQTMVTALENHDMVAARLDIRELNAPEVIKMRASHHAQETGIMSYVYPPYYPHAAGCSLGFKRYIYDATKGFDSAFEPLHDTYFCWKVQRMGEKIHFVKDAVVHYRYRQTLRENYNLS